MPVDRVAQQLDQRGLLSAVKSSAIGLLPFESKLTKGRAAGGAGIRFLPRSEQNCRQFVSRVRRRLDDDNVQQSTFRYWLSEPDSVLRVNFEVEEQARAFAQAFGGVVLA